MAASSAATSSRLRILDRPAMLCCLREVRCRSEWVHEQGASVGSDGWCGQAGRSPAGRYADALSTLAMGVLS